MPRKKHHPTIPPVELPPEIRRTEVTETVFFDVEKGDPVSVLMELMARLQRGWRVGAIRVEFKRSTFRR